MILSRFKGDELQYQGQRKLLVKQLIKKGIQDKDVLEAIQTVPRHLFMESGFVQFAYRDQAFPIESGQTISQPYTVAFQTALLQAKAHQKVLEVGTGSGYQSAILAELGLRVFTIERMKTLFRNARMLLKELDYPVQCFYGDGYEGLPTYGPFDRILITAGAPEIPENLQNQLAIGGILVAPVGSRTHQTMMRCVRNAADQFDITAHGDFVFVPMLAGRSDDQ